MHYIVVYLGYYDSVEPLGCKQFMSLSEAKEFIEQEGITDYHVISGKLIR